MNTEVLLEAFAEMPEEERRAVCGRILLGEGEACWCSEAMRRRLQAMMEEIEASEDPPGMVREMTRLCLERLDDLGEPDSLQPPREWTRTWALPEVV